jgi:protein gp37
VGDQTAIEWSDATWNPWRGCDKVSPGCAHCYMFDGQRRYGQNPDIIVRAAAETFNAPHSRRWRDRAAEIHARENRPLRIFTCSWSDFFHPAADPWRADAWDVIRAHPDYDWQILTKRPERILDHLPPYWGDGWPHVWLGTSIENRRYVHRADQLRRVRSAVRFISAEPLLGPLVYDSPLDWRDAPAWSDVPTGRGYQGPELDLRGVDWLIVGGESGPRHRRLDPTWVRDLRDAAGAASTALFVKQGAGPRPGSQGDLPDDLFAIKQFPTATTRLRPTLDPRPRAHT